MSLPYALFTFQMIIMEIANANPLKDWIFYPWLTISLLKQACSTKMQKLSTYWYLVYWVNLAIIFLLFCSIIIQGFETACWHGSLIVTMNDKVMQPAKIKFCVKLSANLWPRSSNCFIRLLVTRLKTQDFWVACVFQGWSSINSI